MLHGTVINNIIQARDTGIQVLIGSLRVRLKIFENISLLMGGRPTDPALPAPLSIAGFIGLS
ncbi:hypothetical protein [Methylomicrobium sp. Wu6]|uniref:hypothetical protein n=1 Tax=Methylomicrobium sp. Wu6 TaxID=3107928 RepID=UPI002DD64A91|nr:hypothetical protein [Methylomicrobium sp. Wu6]MEC4748902.1 hypothetical protein [Methylomicrobium sp. Wu6]